MMETIDYSSFVPVNGQDVDFWLNVGNVSDFPDNGGLCFKHDVLQIAVFNFSSRKEWYACQNLCPHKMQMILARGMIGSQGGEPKIACPFHKKTFSLKTGECLNGDECAIVTFPVREENGEVYVGLAKMTGDILQESAIF